MEEIEDVVNITKSKIKFFNPDEVTHNQHIFVRNNHSIEEVPTFEYLGP